MIDIHCIFVAHFQHFVALVHALHLSGTSRRDARDENTLNSVFAFSSQCEKAYMILAFIRRRAQAARNG